MEGSRFLTVVRDTPSALLQEMFGIAKGIGHFMPAARGLTTWREAFAITAALWMFVLLIFMPLILTRHQGEGWGSVAWDALTILISILFAMPMFAVFKRTTHLPLAPRTTLLIVTVILTAVANTIFDVVYQTLVAHHLETAWANLPTGFARAYPSALNYTLVFGVNMALFQVSYARRTELRHALQLSQARSAAQQAQLAALRYQLNPHFLFNALNSISALIVTHRNEDAERMTDKLSTFLRSSLNADPGQLIPLEEELALSEEYLDIESVRFGDRLDVSVDCAPDACDLLVPSFLVQPLVENAIKHGVAESMDTVEVDISAEVDESGLCIVVANDMPAKDSGAEARQRGGVGLSNVRRRLRAVYGDEARLTAGREGDRFVAKVCIPKLAPAS
jgi:signal transduction histidine kinase